MHAGSQLLSSRPLAAGRADTEWALASSPLDDGLSGDTRNDARLEGQASREGLMALVHA